jgi:hypothetical protein
MYDTAPPPLEIMIDLRLENIINGCSKPVLSINEKIGKIIGYNGSEIVEE